MRRSIVGARKHFLLLLASISSWAALFVSLTEGRTTPISMSRAWALALVTALAALLVLQGLYAMVSLRLSRSSRPALPAVALLLSVAFLGAAYLSDDAFHFLSVNPIPRTLALASPLVLWIACQEATLVWNLGGWQWMRGWLCKEPSAPLLLFAAFATLYVFTAGGHLYTPDESSMFFVTQNLAERGSIAIPRDEPAIARGLAPFWYSKYGLVPSLLALPSYGLSKIVGLEADPPSPAFPIPNAAPPLIDLLVNPLAAAATCALLYSLARHLGFRPVTSLAVVAAYGLGSSAWVYSKTFLSQPVASLFLICAAYLILRTTHPGWRSYLLAGLCLGLAIGTRVELALLAAPLAVPLITRLRRDPSREVGGIVLFLLCISAIVATTVGWYNYAKTGSVFATGYGAQQSLAGFSREPWLGLFGTFFSPGFGLFLYNPLTLLGIVSLPLLATRRRMEAYVFGGFMLLATLLYGSFGDWFAGFTWANRYMVVFLPYALLPSAMLLEHPWRSKVSLLLWGVAAALGFCINFLAVLFDFNNGWLDLWSRGANIDLILWDPRFSPILAHLRLLHDFFYTGAKLDLYVYYKAGAPALIAIFLFVALAILAARAALLERGNVPEIRGRVPSPGSLPSPSPGGPMRAEG